MVVADMAIMALVVSLWGKEGRRCRGGDVVILAAADVVHDRREHP